MSGLKRKVKRKQTATGALYGNRVDIMNENAVKVALENKDKRVKVLHPTKGHRDISLENFGYVGNKLVMQSIMEDTIKRAGGEMPWNTTENN